MSNDRIHRFHTSVSGIELPAQFTFPFHYVPHPLAVAAAGEVMRYVATRVEWRHELQAGKMLGVLVVTGDNGLGYLAAFSGNLCHSNDWDYFVPPVYDLLQPRGEFRRGEAAITHLNHVIAQLEHDGQAAACQHRIEELEAQCRAHVAQWKSTMRASKQLRDAMRASGCLKPQQEQALIAESQYQKAELKRIKRASAREIDAERARLEEHESRVAQLKQRRKTMSEALQERIFRLFVVSNARGERKDLVDVFSSYYGCKRLPPAGTGECCAPKLLQYAYRHHLQPVCMAEFWYGRSPVGEVRHHGHYYPACQSKCRPLLDFMLQGLDVESNPLAQPSAETVDGERLDIVYDDPWIMVVDKPAGMPTVPGKQCAVSLLDRLRQLLPQATGPLVVHRLDQMTSGLVLVAKTKEVHKELQRQFAEHSIKKRYTAVVAGQVQGETGVIDLPLRPDIDDRPRQLVDPRHGKPAVTRWKVIKRGHDGTTRIAFYPLTGRTHQLRVHASHPGGLNAPIVGDMLYGTAGSRLCLHAESIAFVHPVTHNEVTVESKAKF